MLTVKIENGTLSVSLDANTTNPPRSASGKSRVIASTNGNKTTSVMVDGKPLVIGLNAYIKD